MLQLGGGTSNKRGSLVIVEHMWNPFCNNFSFSQAIGDNKYLLERFELL
jgi:hypothetical protein